MKELVVDNFAGGGGASTGIEAALGRPIDYAINHSPEAIAMHRRNHPQTKHFCESVWEINPRALAKGQSIGLAWFSPDCTYHSKARGSKPFRDRDVARRRRGLAGLVPRWIAAVRPRVIMLENVEEFADWGPLLPDGKPDPKRRGQSFQRWHRQIENLGYQIDMRELRACEYGDPTIRKRLFVIARCDKQEIVFPEATHGPFQGALPYRTAAECIDWSLPCPSIFEPGRDLVDNTLRRVARGIYRFVIDDPNPFIVTARGTDDAHLASSSRSIYEPLRTITSGRGSHHSLVIPTLINTRNGERVGQAPRVHDIQAPYPTITAVGSQGAVVAAFLAKHYGGNEGSGQSLREPLHTVTNKDHHALVYAFLLKYYNTGVGQRLNDPLHTITTKDRFALVQVRGEKHYIADIGMRHLAKRELFRAQGFSDSYVIDHGIEHDGSIVRFNGATQGMLCGNSVPPGTARALVRANVVEQRAERAA